MRLLKALWLLEVKIGNRPWQSIDNWVNSNKDTLVATAKDLQANSHRRKYRVTKFVRFVKHQKPNMDLPR